MYFLAKYDGKNIELFITEFSSLMPLKNVNAFKIVTTFIIKKTFIEHLESFRYCTYQKLYNMVYMTRNRFKFLLQRQYDKKVNNITK